MPLSERQTYALFCVVLAWGFAAIVIGEKWL
jgi:hypothetical protein